MLFSCPPHLLSPSVPSSVHVGDNLIDETILERLGVWGVCVRVCVRVCVCTGVYGCVRVCRGGCMGVYGCVRGGREGPCRWVTGGEGVAMRLLRRHVIIPIQILNDALPRLPCHLRVHGDERAFDLEDLLGLDADVLRLPLGATHRLVDHHLPK